MTVQTDENIQVDEYGRKKVKSATGRFVIVGPHDVQGKRHTAGTPKQWVVDRMKHEQAILDRLDKWDLWKYFGPENPGKMADEYRRLRKSDPTIKDAMRPYLMSASEQKKGIWYRHPITKDFIINMELSDIYIFYIENPLPDPISDKKTGYMSPEQLAEERLKRTVVVEMNPHTGHDLVRFKPGGGIRVPLLGDHYIPWWLQEQGTLKISRYDHTDSRMNPELQGGGARIDARHPIDKVKEVNEDE